MLKLGGQSDLKELRSRILVVGGVFVFGLVVLATNLYRLMVVHHDEFDALSQDNRFKDVRLRAERGLIRDRRGEVLVDSRPSFDVFITPAFCQHCATEVLPRLAETLLWDEDRRSQVEAMVKATRGTQRYQPLAVQADLSRDEVDRLNARLFLLPGVDLESVPHRNYRAGPALAHVLGYMNEITAEELKFDGDPQHDRPAYALGDYIGRRGVERAFEPHLRGRDGWVKQVVDARGQLIRDRFGNVRTGDEAASAPGHNVVLSIDARLQAEAERAFPGQAGAVVVLDAKGFVLAMVSRPAYDPNEMTGRVSPQRLAQLNADPLQPMVFRAGAGHYHPGSTFKVVTMLAALQAGVHGPGTTVSCPGGYRLGSRTWRCHKEVGHGPVEARHALQWSCDTYFYRAADLLGIDPIAKVGKAFGLGSTTGFGVAGEVPGVMPDSGYHDRFTPGGYQKGMALNTAIGQGDVNVTPLQLALLYAAVGNGGTVYQPQVVKRVETVDGRVVQEFAPKVSHTVEIAPEHHRLLVDALTAVVNEPGGTAFRIRQADVLIAGKTGTAQVARLGDVRLKKDQMDYFERDHAWFAAFAPAVDPELTVVVLNEHGGHGGSDAAPAAAAIIRKYFELKRHDAEAFGKEYQPPPAPPKLLIPVAALRVDGGQQAVASTPDAGPPAVAHPDPVEVGPEGPPTELN